MLKNSSDLIRRKIQFDVNNSRFDLLLDTDYLYLIHSSIKLLITLFAQAYLDVFHALFCNM